MLSVENETDLAVSKTAVGEVQVADQEGDLFDLIDPEPFPFALGYTTDPNLVTAGRRISYTLTATNTGPRSATNIILADYLPEGVTIVPGSLSVSQGSCNAGSLQVSCGRGTMENGSVASLDPATVLINNALVLADTYGGTTATTLTAP